MSKWRVFVALVLISNLLMCVGYVLASNYVKAYFRTELTVEKGLSVIFYDNLFHIEIIHPIISDGQILYPPTAIGRGIWNYPFIIFWVSIVGNLVLIALALRKRTHKEKNKML